MKPMESVIRKTGLLFGATMTALAIIALIQLFFWGQVNWTMALYSALAIAIIGLWATRSNNNESTKAKHLLNLADHTINSMQKMLTDIWATPEEKNLIGDFLQKRLKARQRYALLAEGKSNLSEQLAPTLVHYEIYQKAMEGELRYWSNSPASLASYIRELRKD
jgi:hypothetical protein